MNPIHIQITEQGLGGSLLYLYSFYHTPNRPNFQSINIQAGEQTGRERDSRRMGMSKGKIRLVFTNDLVSSLSSLGTMSVRLRINITADLLSRENNRAGIYHRGEFKVMDGKRTSRHSFLRQWR